MLSFSSLAPRALLLGGLLLGCTPQQQVQNCNRWLHEVEQTRELLEQSAPATTPDALRALAAQLEDLKQKLEQLPPAASRIEQARTDFTHLLDTAAQQSRSAALQQEREQSYAYNKSLTRLQKTQEELQHSAEQVVRECKRP